MRERAARHDNNLNLIRLGLATLVLCSHSFPLLYGEAGFEPVSFLTRGQTTGGSLAVIGFFVLSGYLIAQSWSRGYGFRDFLSRRARRIYPGFVVASLFSAIVVPILAGLPWRHGLVPENLSPILIRVVLLNEPRVAGVFADAPYPGMVNASLWTIRYEFFCYLLVAVIGWCGLLRPRVTLGLLVATLGAQALQLAGLLDLNRPIPAPLAVFIGFPQVYPRLLGAFLVGVACYHYRDRLPRSRVLLAVAALLLAVTAILGGLEIALPLGGGYILLYAGFAPASRLARLTLRTDLSYGLYLYAFPVQQLLVQYLGERLTPLTLSSLALVIVGPLAALSWTLVERPFLARSRPTSPQTQPAQPARTRIFALAGLRRGGS